MTIFQVFSIVYIVEEDSHSTDLSVSGEEGDSTILLAHYSTGNKSQKVFFKTYHSKSTAVWLRKKIRRQVFFASNKPENHTTERKRKKWKERGERKEENKKSCAYTLSFYVEFFEEENKHCLINQSIFIPPNITRYILITSAVVSLKIHKTYCIQIIERSKIISKNKPVYKNIPKSISLYLRAISTFVRWEGFWM